MYHFIWQIRRHIKLLRLKFEVVIYCSFAPIVFVGYGIVANSKKMIINRQYFSQMGRSQGKKLISLLINVYVFKEGIQLKKIGNFNVSLVFTQLFFYPLYFKPNLVILPYRYDISTITESLKALAQTKAELQCCMCRKMTPRRFTGPKSRTGSSSIRSNHAHGMHRGIEHYVIFQVNI